MRYLADGANASVTAVTSRFMNTSQLASSTGAMLTASITWNTKLWSVPTVSAYPALEDDRSYSRDTLIVASVLSSFIVILIMGLAILYFLLRRRQRQRMLDYDPPFTSLAPPPRKIFSSQSVRSNPVSPQEPQETHLSMGPGFYTSGPGLHRSESAWQPQLRSARASESLVQSPTFIQLQRTSPSPVDSLTDRPRAQSKLYHDLLREEVGINAARRQSRLEVPGTSSLRPASSITDISDIDIGQLRSVDGERPRGLPSTRASSGVFPDERQPTPWPLRASGLVMELGDLVDEGGYELKSEELG